jgi:hypothetical protein
MTRKAADVSPKIISKAATSLAPAVDSFTVITAFLEYLRVYQEESTKRAEIAARRDVLVTAITVERDFITMYFERRFAERRDALERFFAILDQGVEAGDTIVIDRSLAGILGILQDNPLKDFETFRTSWRDPNITFEL